MPQIQSADVDIQSLLHAAPGHEPDLYSFAQEQHKDPDLNAMVAFLEKKELPQEEDRARTIALQSPLFVMVESVLYFVDSKQNSQK